MAMNSPTTPPFSGEPPHKPRRLLALLATSATYRAFDDALQAIDAANAAEDALADAERNGIWDPDLHADAGVQVNAARDAFRAVAATRDTLHGDSQLAMAAVMIETVLSMESEDDRAMAIERFEAALPRLTVRSTQPQARNVEYMIELAFKRLAHLEGMLRGKVIVDDHFVL